MKKFLTWMLAAVWYVSACAAPSAPVQADAEISTAAALTVQAALASPPAALATPTLASPSSDTPAAPTGGTETSAEAWANFDDVINCRKGPGVNYERVFQTKSGDSLKIVGFFPPNFWIVSTAAGDCWIAGQYVTPVGNLKAVPTVSLPPTPSGGAPKAPSFATNGWIWFCNGTGGADVALAWNDNANTEKGYRVYRNGDLVAELPPDSTSFSETVTYPGGQGLKYEIEVFNEIGSDSVATQAMFCN